MPRITRPKIFRYKLSSIKKNGITGRSSDETHAEWKYWHSFSVGYYHQEVDIFSKKIGWYYREKKILIPKILNNILKFIFGKRYYSISRTYIDGNTYHSELLTKKTAKEYIQECKNEGCTNIYIAWRDIKYNGWLWITKKEKESIKNMMDFMLNMWG